MTVTAGWALTACVATLTVNFALAALLLGAVRDFRRQTANEVQLYGRVLDLEQRQVRVSPSPWANATHLNRPTVVEPVYSSSYPLFYGRNRRPRHLKETP